ncbi:MAG: 4Fe-4S dicluster domain-containing protein [Planctomycetota bacterium]
MVSQELTTGDFVRIDKASLQSIVSRLVELGYRVVGPTIVDGAVAFAELSDVQQLPIGVVDEQEAGHYRLRHTDSGSFFDYVVGPHSLKNYLFPACQAVCSAVRSDDGWNFDASPLAAQPIAAIGVRACDLRALAIQDRVFLGGSFVDAAYQTRRKGLFLLAVNCRRATATCFCHSMAAGPAVVEGADLVLTEMDDHFVLRVDTAKGCEALATTLHRHCSKDEIAAAQAVSESLEESMRVDSGKEPIKQRRHLETEGLHDLLLANLTHPEWDAVAERCLACGNCTMVCPTCFCSSVDEISDLTGDDAHRERRWDSCFTGEHSRMHSGTVRATTAARYRQWLTHKLATWIDQFGEVGCVGCGRCITWCPVGIDLTAEVAAIREGAS